MLYKSNDFLLNRRLDIPIIQRDYVQGSDRWSVKRDEFIVALLDALLYDCPIMLDFIYGIQDNDTFVPLDGQQRLTTLSLLGWLLANIYEKNHSGRELAAAVSDGRAKLGISYKVRDTSREFCEHLFDHTLTNLEKPSQEITNCLWFAERWNYDPTISAMLQMLDSLAAALNSDKYIGNIAEMTERFFIDSPIRFEQTDLFEKTEKIEKDISDDLYIKINARGKHLTEFEHWKVKFIQLLKQFGDKPYPGTAMTYRDYFEIHIEQDWCNFFWDYAMIGWTDSDTLEDLAFPSIDKDFMCFFKCVTEAFFSQLGETDFKKHIEKNPDEVYRKVYSHRTFVNALFNMLDALAWFKDSYNAPTGKDEETNAAANVADFFAKHLCSITDPKDPALTARQEVNIFNENDGRTNLFKALLATGSLAERPRLLLFGILLYIKRHQSAAGIQEFIRQWWTFIMNLHRQRLTDSLAVRADISLKDHGREFFWGLTRLIDGIVAPVAVNSVAQATRNAFATVPYPAKFPGVNFFSEIVPLLNSPWLLADIGVMRDVLNDPAVTDPATRFYDVFVKAKNADRVTMLLRHGYEGCRLNKGSNFAFGICSKTWEYILTSSDKALASAIHGALTNTPAQTPVHWLLKFVNDYSDILGKASNKFAAFIKEGKYQLFGSEIGRSIKRTGYRLEPFAWVVANLAGAVIDPNNSNWATYTNSKGHTLKLTLFSADSTLYGICFADYRLSLKSNKNGWQLTFYSDDHPQLPQDFTNRFGSPEQFLTDSQGVFIILLDGTFQDSSADHVADGVNVFRSIADTLN